MNEKSNDSKFLPDNQIISLNIQDEHSSITLSNLKIRVNK